MKTWIDRRFGTWRGLARAVLAFGELATGRLQPFQLRNRAGVRRLVFVCHGNICRSAFGHAAARDSGLNVTSLGLSTTSGVGSPAQALAAAARQGHDMQAHLSLSWDDFAVAPGDLFLVMEVRQAHEVRRRLGKRTDVTVCLLGMWCSPAKPHLHDPFTLGDDYFDSCFARIAQATRRLLAELSGLSHAASPMAAEHEIVERRTLAR